MHGLFRALGHPEWIEDPRFGAAASRSNMENATALGEKIETAMIAETTEVLLQKMLDEDVPVGPVLDLDQLFADEQLGHNGSILDFEHPTAGRYHQARPAARFGKTAQDPQRRMPPLHGEHTEEVLGELGYPQNDLDRLKANSTVLIPD
jgi:crotonobetainyl-CoA:carnitine CoA-transferase CaiB-like acyl-CoA transferase